MKAISFRMNNKTKPYQLSHTHAIVIIIWTLHFMQFPPPDRRTRSYLAPAGPMIVPLNGNTLNKLQMQTKHVCRFITSMNRLHCTIRGRVCDLPTLPAPTRTRFCKQTSDEDPSRGTLCDWRSVDLDVVRLPASTIHHTPASDPSGRFLDLLFIRDSMPPHNCT